jgi:MoaA/NifB/PqqE/SkfB family radical SAM enzyme
MKESYKELQEYRYYIWGNGNMLRRYVNQLPEKLVIEAVIDKNPEKCGEMVSLRDGVSVKCILPSDADTSNFVIVALENPTYVKEVASFLDEKGMRWCHIFDVTDAEFLSAYNTDDTNNGNERQCKIVKFIDTTVPVSSCNLRCDYCYLEQNNTKLDNDGAFYHHPLYIRKALSKKRLGGCAFINLCGVGETLLCNGLLGIVEQLVQEGHYIQIVTNATITKKIDEFVESQIDFSHMFFKCSLHYKEFKKRKLLDIFKNNINKIKERGGSYGIELVPTDDIVEYIDEIKKYCLEAFGALPHVTVTRDESYEDYRLLTSYSYEEYRKVWEGFESPMFEFKMANLQSPKDKICKAGLWAAELNLATGELYKCVNNPRLCNVYENLEEDIYFEEIGKGCCLPYCFNNHAYITLGLMPDVEAPTYLEMRDRVTPSGEHWIKETIGEVFSQKLYLNN